MNQVFDKLAERLGARDEDRLHIFIIHSPIAIVLSAMISDALNLRRDNILAVSERGTNTTLTRFQSIPLITRKYDRYFNRITGRHLGAIRLRRELKKIGREFTLYAPWFYSTVEELTRSKLCSDVVMCEEGQLSFHPSTPYEKRLRNSWRFRRKKLFKGEIHLWFRQDAVAYMCMSPDAFPAIPDDKKFVLKNLEAASKGYQPRLKDIKNIGLMPAPRRLSEAAFIPALEKLARALPGPGAIRLHPGYKFEKYYSLDTISDVIERASDGQVCLCPEDAIIELEMLGEKKVVFGAQTSLSRYARFLGSKFIEFEFDHYEKPLI